MSKRLSDMENDLIKIMKENKCVWRKMAEDPKSTTFEDVRRTNNSHPLRKCYEICSGYDFYCKDYRMVKEFK